jgi:2-oxo-4-hydroxy-4-carboxy-5-ureidoimidazoline decarboxylase
MTLAQLNALDRSAFIGATGWIFEESPWVAERVWPKHPFRSVDDLHAAMTAIVHAATDEERLALLRAHPDLGARARMSSASEGEQRGAGLDRLTRVEFERLQRLNTEYRTRFGFPFLFAVKGSTRDDVLDALERRCGASRQAELQEAMQQVFRIAKFRLDDLIAEG